MLDYYVILLILLLGIWTILEFVKDKSNLLNYNIWSAGDYLHTLNGFTKAGNGNLIISNESSINGDYSIKATPTSNQYCNVILTPEFDESKTYLFYCYCKNQISGANLQLRDNNSIISSVTIPVAFSFQYISLELNHPLNNYTIVFRTYNSNYPLFIDNLNLQIL